MRVALLAKFQETEQEQTKQRDQGKPDREEDQPATTQPGSSREMGKESFCEYDRDSDTDHGVIGSQAEGPDPAHVKQASIMHKHPQVGPVGAEPARDDKPLLQYTVRGTQQQDAGPAQTAPAHQFTHNDGS